MRSVQQRQTLLGLIGEACADGARRDVACRRALLEPCAQVYERGLTGKSSALVRQVTVGACHRHLPEAPAWGNFF